jgi:hypothetical protein
MKQVLLALTFCVGAYAVQAQTNLLTDGGFETLPAGYNKFIVNNSGKTKGMSGKWQMVFAKGSNCEGPCGQGTASVVTSSKVGGNNAVEIKIEAQTNRNDIRLFQSINAVPAGVYEISFYVKTDQVSPVAIDILKSTQPSTNNGAAPYTGNFTATTEWQQFKLTVDISDWTDEERNELRISIRLNNNKALPTGPFPKTYWVDDVSLVKVQ